MPIATRLAGFNDIPALTALIAVSVRELSKGYYSDRRSAQGRNGPFVTICRKENTVRETAHLLSSAINFLCQEYMKQIIFLLNKLMRLDALDTLYSEAISEGVKDAAKEMGYAKI